MPKTWIEYRVIFRVPASILSTSEERNQGYEERKTEPHLSEEDARLEALHNSEESHAWVVGYEKRLVSVSEWVPSKWEADSDT